MPMRAYNRCTARLIPRSWQLERCDERGDYVIRGGRLLAVLSRRRDLQKPSLVEVLSAFLGEARIVGGLELASLMVRWRRAGFFTKKLSSTAGVPAGYYLAI